MRDVKFRGRNVDTGEWVYGYLVGRTGYTVFSKYYIVTSDEGELEFTEVDYDTIGQYTGLKDKNGVEIYEGDIVHALFNSGDEDTNEVEWSEENAAFGIADSDDDELLHHLNGIVFIEVVGNIYENPELLK